MVPNADVYLDAEGKITKDPEKYARQLAVKGVFLEDKVATRYGLADMLVSTDEPNAPRRSKGEARGEASVKIIKADEEGEESQEPQEPVVDADEPKATKAAAKKGEKKK